MSAAFAWRRSEVAAGVVGCMLYACLVIDAAAGKHPPAAPANAAYQAECGSCHIAYPPRFLAAPTWLRIVEGLDRHFGVDASVDTTTAAALRAHLEANALPPGSKRYEPAAARITEARWFRKEHGGIGAGTWQRGSVKSPTNCAACHTRAEEGSFDERDVRIPRP